MKEEEIFICECSDIKHQIIMTYYPNDDKKVYANIHLNKFSFWKRLWHSIKYLFGYSCDYGDFEEFIFDARDADKLQKIVDYLKA